MDPVIEINGSIINAVPAVHYRALFARQVNYLCSCEETRPDAVAVELGPHMTREIAVWMKELGIGNKKGVILPCMLGILVRNRLIHPDFRETAFRLQEHYGKPLHEISPVLQKQLLHFSEKYLIGLSSTDSIIEAVRCAVELGIPVFGVDMDEFSVKPGEHYLIEDPDISTFNLGNYVSKNEKIASGFRDPYIDGRREYVMAARLKFISAKHKRVLYTGGLAHWESIKGLLKDSAVRPSDILIPEESPDFTRVIVHPKTALTFMDIYPILTTIYEQNRHNPLIKGKYIIQLPGNNRIYRDIFCETCKKYFSNSKAGLPAGKSGNEIQRITDFERLVANMQMIQQHNAPSVADMLRCAQSMMHSAFSALLTSQLMDIGRSWASPEQFPGLPLVAKMRNEPDEGFNQISIDLFQLIGGSNYKKDKEQPYINRSGKFTLEYHHSNPVPEHLFRSWIWEGEPEGPQEQRSYFDWVWPPCESLLFGSAYEASRMAVTRSNKSVSAPFEGSLYNGLDIKATIRSAIKGEKKIYIRKPSSSKETFSPDGKKPEPTVFIFDESRTDIKSTWSLLIAGTNIRSHIKDKSKYDEVTGKYGNCFVSSISRVCFQEAPAHFKRFVDSYSILEGITAFGSPCINARQGAQWVEDNDFKCGPVLDYTSIGALIEYYGKHHKMDISESDWKTALILFALPFARERVVVVAPVNFKITDKPKSEAKRRNVSIDLLPLNYFPVNRIAEMRQRIMVRAKDSDGFAFPPDVEKALGQKSDKYMELLPLYMQQQLGKTF